VVAVNVKVLPLTAIPFVVSSVCVPAATVCSDSADAMPSSHSSTIRSVWLMTRTLRGAKPRVMVAAAAVAELVTIFPKAQLTTPLVFVWVLEVNGI